MRAKIILNLAEGKSYDWVQQNFGVGRQAVAKLKGRFIGFGVAGLQDKSGRGAVVLTTSGILANSFFNVPRI